MQPNIHTDVALTSQCPAEALVIMLEQQLRVIEHRYVRVKCFPLKKCMDMASTSTKLKKPWVRPAELIAADWPNTLSSCFLLCNLEILCSQDDSHSWQIRSRK